MFILSCLEWNRFQSNNFHPIRLLFRFYFAGFVGVGGVPVKYKCQISTSSKLPWELESLPKLRRKWWHEALFQDSPIWRHDFGGPKIKWPWKHKDGFLFQALCGHFQNWAAWYEIKTMWQKAELSLKRGLLSFLWAQGRLAKRALL